MSVSLPEWSIELPLSLDQIEGHGDSRSAMYKLASKEK